MSKDFFTIALLFILPLFTTAQDTINHSWFFSNGLAIPSTKETHYSSNFRSGIGYHVQLGYERSSLKSINKISTSFLKASQGKGNVSYSNLLRPQLSYEHLRLLKDKGIHIGGQLDIGSLLNFRRGTWPNENSINYTIWTSIGIAAQYDKSLNIKKRKLSWTTTISAPLLTYLIRPSYTFPYTDNYLESGVFDFGRSGLGKKIITGGKINSLNRFLNLKIQSGIILPFEKSKWQFGISYTYNYLHTNEIKPVFHSVHSVNFIIKY